MKTELDELIDAMRQAQGGMSQDDFGDSLGITQSLISMIYSKSQEPGARFLMALKRTYPETSQAVDNFFDYKYRKTDKENHQNNTPSVTVGAIA